MRRPRWCFQGEPLQFPEGLQEHHQRFAELGEWVRGRTSVRGVFGQRVSGLGAGAWVAR